MAYSFLLLQAGGAEPIGFVTVLYFGKLLRAANRGARRIPGGSRSSGSWASRAADGL